MSSPVSPLTQLEPLLVDPSEIAQLTSLLQEKTNPVVFDVVEPHGEMHLPQALLKGIILKTLAEAGFTVVLYVADWISFLHSFSFFLSLFLHLLQTRTMWQSPQASATTWQLLH